MTIRNIPYNRGALVQAGVSALAGAEHHGASLRLLQSDAGTIATDLHDFIGDPTAPANQSKTARLMAARDGLVAAQKTKREAVRAGRKFCSDAVDTLKAHLGRTWNTRWEAVGFSRFSLATSRGNPLDTLFLLWGYFKEHPERENAPNGTTAAAAQARIDALGAAQRALDLAGSERLMAIMAYEASKEQLRRRLRALRHELDLLLSPDDPRWRDFGFTRPVDRRRPEPVTEVVAEPVGPGSVVVSHAAAPRATGYRIRWAPAESDEFTEVGLFGDLVTHLTGLPRGIPITVHVTARNEAGETPPTTVTVVAS